MWGWITALMLGAGKILKLIFGMAKPKEIEVHEIGQKEPPKSDFDSRFERMQRRARAYREGQDNDSSRNN